MSSCDTLGLPNLQLITVSVQIEDPDSALLARSILPAGVGPAPAHAIFGSLVGAYPGNDDYDNRFPQVVYQGFLSTIFNSCSTF